MWVFRNNAFVSAVEDRDMPDQLWVRARVRGDIERFFKGCVIGEVIQTDQADYRFRVVVDRGTFKQALIEAVNELDYDNFKSSIDKGPAGDRRHDWYMRIWSAGMAEQSWEKGQDARRKGNKKGAKS